MIAVIFGSAGCAFDNWGELKPLLQDSDYQTFAVNFASLLPINFNYVVSLHSEYIKTYENCALIRANEHKYRKSIYTVSPKNATYCFQSSHRGTSGRYAIDFARSIGATKIILCGMPMDGTERFYGDIVHDYSVNMNEDAWQGQDQSTLKSMSGNTKEFFGAPTLEWINKGEDR